MFGSKSSTCTLFSQIDIDVSCGNCRPERIRKDRLVVLRVQVREVVLSVEKSRLRSLEVDSR